MKPRRQQSIDLDPAEWDFTKVKPGLASRVLRYELARSSPRACEDIGEILSQTFSGKSLQTILLNLAGALDENAVRLVFGGSQSGAYSFRILKFAADHPFFPTPWNKLPQEQRLILEESLKRQNQNDLVIEALTEDSAKNYLERIRNNPDYSFAIVALDLVSSSPKVKLLGKFKGWLNKQPVVKLKRGRGAITAEPFADLRALAAYRFKNAGVSREDAVTVMMQRAIDGRIDLEKREAFSPVRRKWPYFDDAGNWSRALQRANKLIRDWEMHFKPSIGWAK